MAMLPAGDLEFDASYGGRPSPGITYSGDVQFPWEPSPRTRHQQLLSMHPMYMDVHPVTNRQYALYLGASGYTPPVSEQNWLKHWPLGPAGGPPVGWEEKPVTWVSRDDATAYCAHYGKRLPHTWEWQWAAQGQFADSDAGDEKFYSSNHSSSRRSLDEAPPPPPPGDFPWCRVGTPCSDEPSRYPPRSNNGEQVNNTSSPAACDFIGLF
jgi:formylglycine-generating enzyme required for sulfatase activity